MMDSPKTLLRPTTPPRSGRAPVHATTVFQHLPGADFKVESSYPRGVRP